MGRVRDIGFRSPVLRVINRFIFIFPCPLHAIAFKCYTQPHGCTWVVLWLFCFRSTPQRSLIHGPLSRVLFGECLVVRLYSEIYQTYLSIEAQCVSHYYPRWTATLWFTHSTVHSHECETVTNEN